MFEKLFNIIKKRNISTKDLYLVSLKYCHKCSKKYAYFKPLNVYVLVQKVEKDYKNCKDYYEDIFTHTVYDCEFIIYEEGKVYIQDVFPIISSLEYISKEEAKLIISKKNPILIEENITDENNIELSKEGIGFRIEPIEDGKKLIKK